MASRSLKSSLQFAAVALWGAGIACGLAYAWKYESTPTASADAGRRWPAGSACTLASDRATLVMFVHPHCPCSRASMEELATLMTHCRGRLDAQVLFLQPASFSAEWTHSDLWDSAARIPGVVPRIDPEGSEQQRFGAHVSGEVFVYLPGGRLLFHGGITGGRGHAGDNAGRSAVESFFCASPAAASTTPVYGCRLGAAGPSCTQTAVATRPGP